MYLATLQGSTFAGIRNRLNEKELPDSVILYHNDEFHFRSAAALRILSMLPFPYNMSKVLKVVPRILSDQVYNWLAGRRYSIFGRRTECRVPTPEEKERFLE
jgi:predicted DCC family thiol-disulfide oxidoreductase YuxK